jgi:hypothetical protein
MNDNNEYDFDFICGGGNENPSLLTSYSLQFELSDSFGRTSKLQRTILVTRPRKNYKIAAAPPCPHTKSKDDIVFQCDNNITWYEQRHWYEGPDEQDLVWARKWSQPRKDARPKIPHDAPYLRVPLAILLPSSSYRYHHGINHVHTKVEFKDGNEAHLVDPFHIDWYYSNNNTLKEGTSVITSTPSLPLHTYTRVISLWLHCEDDNRDISPGSVHMTLNHLGTNVNTNTIMLDIHMNATETRYGFYHRENILTRVRVWDHNEHPYDGESFQNDRDLLYVLWDLESPPSQESLDVAASPSNMDDSITNVAENQAKDQPFSMKVGLPSKPVSPGKLIHNDTMLIYL